VIRDLDGQLSGLRVVDGGGKSDPDVVPISLNSIDYYATDFTVDEPHSRGPNDFRATSLMSPHKYATLNIESVTDPPGGIPATFHVELKRDMPAYGDTVYPTLFLNGRGQNPIYEPFVMDRMGYTIYGLTGIEHGTTSPAPFTNRLLFSYTDPSVKKSGDFFINRIAVYQPLSDSTKWKSIAVSRIRRQWGTPYDNAYVWPPNLNPPDTFTASCDNTFFDHQPTKEARWADCVARAHNQAPPNPWRGAPIQYSGGMILPPASDWSQFEQPFQTLMGKSHPTANDIKTFINAQTFYYDTKTSMLYFYMIEDKPVQRQYSPFGTCDAANYNTGANYLSQIQQVKPFSDPNSIKAALDVSCFVNQTTLAPQPTDLFTCHETGCVSYLVDFSNAGVNTTPPAPPPPQPITGVSGTSPICITSSTTPPAGTSVVVSGVQGITGANGTWVVPSTSNCPAGTFALTYQNGSNSTGSGTYTANTGAWNIVPHPIFRSDYNNWNQYHFVYDTPTQQPNGVPVAANPAVGNTAPPPDGTPLSTLMTPTDGTPPPSGDQVTYTFLNLQSSRVSVAENFRYHCVKTPPWAPVNARGTYPPGGGTNYPLVPTVCTKP